MKETYSREEIMETYIREREHLERKMDVCHSWYCSDSDWYSFYLRSVELRRLDFGMLMLMWLLGAIGEEEFSERHDGSAFRFSEEYYGSGGKPEEK